jgi:glycosyltransferase involved in cell wall biosynthesis
MEEQITIINRWNYPTAIYNYSRALSSISPYTKVIDITDKALGPPISRKIKLFNLAYLGVNNILNVKEIKENSIVHYADPMIAPFKLKNLSVVTIHDNPFKLLKTDLYDPNRLSRNYLERIFKKFRTIENVLTNTNYVKQHCEEFGFEGEITTVYLPVAEHFKYLQEKHKLRRELGLPEDKFLILSVSTNTKRKNLGIVKKVMRELDGRFRLVRIGETLGNDYSFKDISNDQVNVIYNACDLLLIPSIEEGQGLPVTEAFTVGLPVVASDLEVFHEIAGESAVFVNPTDYVDIIDGIKTIINEKDKYIRIGLKRSKLFTHSIFREKMLKYYNSLK